MKKVFKVMAVLACLGVIVLPGLAKSVDLPNMTSTIQNAAAFEKLRHVPIKGPIIPL